jgi:hypothetical protein
VVSAFEARRRRKNRGGDEHNYRSSSDYESDPAKDGKNGRRGRNRRKKSEKNGKNGKDLPKKEADPYDSDPGESYREHCERIQEERSRSCLVLPRFLKDGKFLNKHNSVGNSSLPVKVLHNGGTTHIGGDDKSGATSPPSPLLSEPDSSQPLNPLDNKGTPASLPRDLARVRYSLRTSIGDGTDVQPGGSASMMERRELRPNNIHINVSHWSDFGGRNYMEDR